MVNNDIAFENEGETVKFNFRVALLSVNNGKILLQKANNVCYYSLIGGRVQFLEDTRTAIIREVMEETGVKIKNSELCLIKIIENFFTYQKTPFHELLYIYKVTNNELFKMDNFPTLDTEGVINKWINIDELGNMDVRPDIVKSCWRDETLSNDIIHN